jgi:hypothetical protein
MPSFFDQLVGTKPSVPQLPQLNLQAEAGKAIAGNLANLPAAETLIGQTNQFNRDQITQMLQATIPGYSNIASTASGNIESMLQGNIPKDVQDAIARADAASALTGGYAGTGASRNLVARDLGLTSLNLTQQGLSSAESWTKTMQSLYEPSMINVSSMFVSPMQQYQTDNEQNMQQFQRQWMQNQINAMPAPWAEDLKQFVYRAMAAYSGTSVGNNPYSTPGSFGGGLNTSSFEGGASGFSSDFGGTGGGLDVGGGGEGGAAIGLDSSGGGGFSGIGFGGF